jgi:hypothetical protein
MIGLKVLRLVPRSLVTASLLFTVLTTQGSTHEHFHADHFEKTSMIPVFNVSPVIDEVSAAVIETKNGFIWTLGDSDTGAIIGRTNIDMHETISVHITGAENHDWEAMVMDEAGRLWILDVGDNLVSRDHVTFYQADPRDLTEDSTLPVIQSITVTYPEGPMDAEAAAYAEGLIYIIERTPLLDTTLDKARVVAVDISENADSEQVATSAGTVPIHYTITDASVSPEGFLYLLTYVGIYVSKNWREADRNALPVKLFFFGKQESIMALGRNRFYVGIETGAFYYISKWFPLPPFTAPDHTCPK